MNFQMFTDGVQFPYDNVYTLATSNLNLSAVQLHYIHIAHILQNFNFTLPTLQCVPFTQYTWMRIRQPVNSTVGITGNTTVASTT